MSDVTRRALEAYRAKLVTEFSANITALDAALQSLGQQVKLDGSDIDVHMSAGDLLSTLRPEAGDFLSATPPAVEQIPYVNPHVAAPEPVVVQQTYADGGYVDTPAEQPALVKSDGPTEPWAVPAATPAAPAEKKGRRTNEEIAAEYGVDLKDVEGTGKNGRITHDDIKAAGEAKAKAAAEPAQQFAPPPAGFAQEAQQQAQQAPQQVQPTPEQFAAFQAQQQAGQPYAQPQLQQPYPQPQVQQQFTPPQVQQPAFVPPPALPEGFAPQQFQQAY